MIPDAVLACQLLDLTAMQQARLVCVKIGRSGKVGKGRDALCGDADIKLGARPYSLQLPACIVGHISTTPAGVTLAYLLPPNRLE